MTALDGDCDADEEEDRDDDDDDGCAPSCRERGLEWIDIVLCVIFVD